jgi:hypothetical protein
LQESERCASSFWLGNSLLRVFKGCRSELFLLAWHSQILRLKKQRDGQPQVQAFQNLKGLFYLLGKHTE